MNSLTVFGLFAVTAMVVCYVLENRSHWFVLGFAFSFSGVLGSIYGFLQGAWPFGIVDQEVVASVARNGCQIAFRTCPSIDCAASKALPLPLA